MAALQFTRITDIKTSTERTINLIALSFGLLLATTIFLFVKVTNTTEPLPHLWGHQSPLQHMQQKEQRDQP
jgi:hypothetical protein